MFSQLCLLCRGRFLPQLLAAPINGLLSMNKTEALYDPTQGPTTVTHNPVAAHAQPNGTTANGKGVTHTDSHIGPHAINPNTTPAV